MPQEKLLRHLNVFHGELYPQDPKDPTYISMEYSLQSDGSLSASPIQSETPHPHEALNLITKTLRHIAQHDYPHVVLSILADTAFTPEILAEQGYVQNPTDLDVWEKRIVPDPAAK